MRIIHCVLRPKSYSESLALQVYSDHSVLALGPFKTMVLWLNFTHIPEPRSIPAVTEVNCPFFNLHSTGKSTCLVHGILIRQLSHWASATGKGWVEVRARKREGGKERRTAEKRDRRMGGEWEGKGYKNRREIYPVVYDNERWRKRERQSDMNMSHI